MAARRDRPTVSISSSQQAIRVPRKRIAELTAFVVAAEGGRLAEVDVAVVGTREMARLNRLYLHRGGATDVLSFDLSGTGATGVSAQIVVCGEVAVREAEARRLRPQHELLRYVLHGLLHVLGYDDRSDAEAARMHERQEQLLGDFLHLGRSGRRGGGGQADG